MSPRLEIGETLRSARSRAGIEFAELERRTHIRTRYLRALEDENWEELPDDTYARSFLRTYAEELALDADALTDELRLRQGGRVGGAEPLVVAPASEQRPPSRWAVGLVAAAIAVLLLVLWQSGDRGRDGEDSEDRTGRTAGSGPGQEPSRGAQRPPRASLSLVPLDSARVCVASAGKALIARQTLSSANRERFAPSRRFLVDLEVGEIRLRTPSDNARLRAATTAEPLSVSVEGGRIKPVPYSGDSCP